MYQRVKSQYLIIFVGTYDFKREVLSEDKDEYCFDGCLYTKDDGSPDEYCFRAVSKNPANINYQCSAPQPTTGLCKQNFIM